MIYWKALVRHQQMKDDEIKILIKGNKVITLRELFEGKKETRKEMAKLPFTEKIGQLIELQKVASSWGNRKDVIVWKIS